MLLRSARVFRVLRTLLSLALGPSRVLSLTAVLGAPCCNCVIIHGQKVEGAYARTVLPIGRQRKGARLRSALLLVGAGFVAVQS